MNRRNGYYTTSSVHHVEQLKLNLEKIMNTLTLLNEIEEAKGKEKVAIMSQNMSELLKLIFRYTYSKKIIFGIKDFGIPESTGDHPLTALDLEVALQLIIDSSTPTETVTQVLSKFNPDNQEVIARIIRKDLRIGASASSFNKAVGYQYVYQHPYNRCSSLNEKTAKKIKFPCLSQVKSDGKFADLMVEPVAPIHDGLEQSATRFCNRDGVTMSILSEKTLQRVTEALDCSNGLAISGELLYMDEDGDILPRETGNGILNSDEIDEQRVLFRVWDARTVEYNSDPYNERLDFLAWLVDALKDVINIEITDTRQCHSWEEIGEHYKECRLAGEEGTIVKNMYFQFKDGTSPDCIKLKAVVDGEVLVTGVTEGEKKWTGVGIGALLIESSCGMMKCSCGTGLTDKQRIDYYNDPNLIVGKVVRVLYNGVVKREGEEEMALYLPRFVEIRDDKTEADSLTRLIEQEKASIDILTKWG